MTNHTELIARLEAAEVGSREMGRDILVALNQVREVDEFTYYGIGTEQVLHFGENSEDDGKYHILPDPSSSLDAALALAERVLPEVTNIAIKTYTRGKYHHCEIECEWGDFGSNNVRNPAIALCIAILRALDAKTTAP